MFNSDCAECKREVSLRFGRKISGINCARCDDYYHLSCLDIDKAVKKFWTAQTSFGSAKPVWMPSKSL